MTKITAQDLKKFNQRFISKPEHLTAMNNIAKNGLEAASTDVHAKTNFPDSYSVETLSGQITNQRSSGRCWMFAALNQARVEVMKKTNQASFEFSQTYPYFYDKLEKSNYFLENILNTLDEPLNGRLMAHLLSSPVQDGGQWDMFKGLLAKYGAVPNYIMPDTFASMNSSMFVGLLTKKLRSGAKLIRDQHQAGKSRQELTAVKEELMTEIYTYLCVNLGNPPESFDYQYRDKDQNFHRDVQITPLEFFKKYVGWNLDDKIHLINAPTQDKPYYQCYTVKYLGSVIEAEPIRYVNVPSEVMKKAAIASLKDGEPVWFGCDVGQSLQKEYGIMDLKVLSMDNLLDMKFLLDKAGRLDYGDSALTHAMLFVGVGLDEQGRSTRWKVENSWGEDRGMYKGYYVMSDAWFDEFNYEIMIDRKYLDPEVLKVLEQPLIELEPWDPFGALAK